MTAMEHNFEFGFDWISGYHPLWDRLLPRTALNVLEIGCFEGRSTVWFLQRHPGTTITCIDTFEGGLDLKQAGVDFSDTERRFQHNTAPWAADVTLRKGNSADWLRCITKMQFDVVLVDGSHLAADVLTDIILSWPLLAKGGTMIFDDYLWGLDDRQPYERPQPAIDAFLKCYYGQYEQLEKGYQCLVRKL